MEHVGSDKQRKWGVDSQKCSVFSPEKLVHFWNLCKFRDFWFSFYAQIALKQRIDSKHCLSNGGITRKSIFCRKIVKFQLLIIFFFLDIYWYSCETFSRKNSTEQLLILFPLFGMNIFYYSLTTAFLWPVSRMLSSGFLPSSAFWECCKTEILLNTKRFIFSGRQLLKV